MKKNWGLIFLAAINGCVLYLIYQHLSIICSTKADNILHVPYEPSGMQVFYYLFSFPFFMILACLSVLHSYYFDLRQSLGFGILIIWLAYFILLVYVDAVLHFSSGHEVLYYGSQAISGLAIFYIIYVTYCQCLALSR